MAITYTLKVTQMDCLPQAEGETDVVFRVHWAYTGTDGTNSGGFGGTTDVTYQQGTPFTPYADLTEEQVANWVLAAWTADQKASYEQTIAAQIEVAVPPLPWGSSTAPEPAVA